MIHWKPEWNVGHPQIDSQHQIIVSLLNLNSHSEYSALQRSMTLPQCIEQMRHHIVYEETLMGEIQYQDTENHKTLHGVFFDHIRQYESAKKQVSDLSQIEADLISFFRDWWLHHIIHEDSKFKPYFSQNPSGTTKQHHREPGLTHSG